MAMITYAQEYPYWFAFLLIAGLVAILHAAAAGLLVREFPCPRPTNW